MTEPPAGEPPEPRTAATPSEFVERLRELRLWAGEPPLRRLRELAGTTVDPAGNTIDALPVSTASHVLRGDRLPRMEFVRAFVTACLRNRDRDQGSVAKQLERWHEAWLSLRREGPPGPVVPDVPRQLPVDAADFTGRANELALLERLLAVVNQPGPVVVSAIDGVGGIGKSTLAIRVAHRLADRFPDGQLYVDLHGATAGIDPLAPLEALSRFLRTLGVSGRDIPDQVDEAAAAFRTRVADRRLLLVLDNAVDGAQIRPLLPGSAGSQVLVTSRQPLAGVAGANHVTLPALSGPEAIELLSRIVGQERVAAEPDAAAETVSRCGYLPLALRIVGARLVARPSWTIATLALRLADEQRRLDELQVAQSDVRACFGVSYQQLRDSPDPVDQSAAKAFGRLGAWGGPDLALPVAARLLDRPEPETERLLERLVDARLLEARTLGRYQFHDLLRLYARERADHELSNAERTSALERALRFYTASAWGTLAKLRPGDRRYALADPRWRAGGVEFTDSVEALAWLEAERPNLLASATRAAGSHQLAPAPIQLAQALFGFFSTRRYLADWEQIDHAALESARTTKDQAAEAQALNDLGALHNSRRDYRAALEFYRPSLAIRQRLGDRGGQAISLSNLGFAYTKLGHHDEALAHLQQSLSLRRTLDDRHGEAVTLYNLGQLLAQMGRLGEAITSHRQSLAIFQELGSLHGQASTLNDLGSVYGAHGQYREALGCLRQSLGLYRELGDRWGQAGALDTIGTIYRRQERYHEALDCHRQSLATLRELGSRHDEAEVLRNLGVVLQALGRLDEAHAHWAEAMAICEELQLPTDDLRGLLAPNH